MKLHNFGITFIFSIITFLFCFAPFIPQIQGEEEPSSETMGQPPTAMKITRFSEVKDAFLPGEKLEYEVSWLGITAGISVMTVDTPMKLGDTIVWPLRSGAETKGLLRRLYLIDNKTVSYIDPQFCYPLLFEVDQYAGKKEEKIRITFNQMDKKAIWYRMYKGEESSGEADVIRGIQDSLSSIYYLRNQVLTVGESVIIPVFASRKKWKLQANVEERETIEVPLGKFDTFRIKPIMLPESEGKPKGTMTLWLSVEDGHFPVKISSEVPVGSVTMKLKSRTAGTQPE